jgi:hypothetical protein
MELALQEDILSHHNLESSSTSGTSNKKREL